MSFNKKIIFFFIILTFSSKVFANEKNKIIENLIEIKNLTFNFEQNINGKVENGKCTIEYPKKIKKLKSKKQLASYIKDYYFSNVICRASKTMGNLAKSRGSSNLKKASKRCDS